MTKETFLQMVDIFCLMKAGNYIDALDRMTAFINAIRNYSADYNPNWEKTK